MRKASRYGDVLRQGDVLLVPKETPISGKWVPPIDGRNIVAEGELTGHHHSLPAEASDVFMGEFGKLEAQVQEPTSLTHQEHDALPAQQGSYDVVIQRSAGYLARTVMYHGD